MKLAFFVALVISLFGDNLSLPVEKETSEEDLATRCIVEVLSKALSKPNTPPVDPECKGFLNVGLTHEPAEKKNDRELVYLKGISSQGPLEVKRQEQGANLREGDNEEIKEIEDFLKSAQEKEVSPEDAGSEENINRLDEKKYYNQENGDQHMYSEDEDDKDTVSKRNQNIGSEHKLSDEKVKKTPTYRNDLRSAEDFEDEWTHQEKRSEELENNEEKERRIWAPSHRYHQMKNKQNGVSWNGGQIKESEESEEDENRDKRVWRPSHQYHHKKHKQYGDSSEESKEQRSQEERSEELEESDVRDKRIPAHHHNKHKQTGDSLGDKLKKYSDDSDEDEERDEHIWKQTPRYYHQKHKRSRGSSGEERSEEWQVQDRSSEFSEDDEEKEKRSWKPHRYQHKKHKRSRDSSETGQSDESEESEEDEDGEKRIWRPTYRYHHKKQNKNGYSSKEEETRNNSDEDDEDDNDIPFHARERKSHFNEVLEEVNKRRNVEDDEGLNKRHHLLEKRHYIAEKQKQDYNEDEKRSQEEEEDKVQALRYLAQKRNEAEQNNLSEGEMYEKRSPWEYRGYYHPAWWKRSTLKSGSQEMEERKQIDDEWWDRREAGIEIFPHHLKEKRPYPTHNLHELAKLLNYKKEEFPGMPEPLEKRTLRQRPLTPEEEKEVASLAAMDMELQKIAEKIHKN